MQAKMKKWVDYFVVLILGAMCYMLLFNNSYVHHLGGDVGDAAYGMLSGIENNLKNGELPLWNPYLCGGMSQVGTSTSQAFYPVTYFLCKLCYNEEVGMLSCSAVVHLSILIHIFILAAGIYFLLRVLNFHHIIAFSIAALAPLSGCIMRLRGWQNLFSSLSYIPLFLGLAILMMNSREKKHRLLYSAFAGVIFGLSGLASASHGNLMLLLVFAMFYFVYMWDFRRDKVSMLQCTGYCVLTGIIGMGIMSVSLLPFIEFLGESSRYIGDSVISGQEKTSFEGFTVHNIGLEGIRDMAGGYSGWLSIGIILMIFVIVGLFSKVKKNRAAYWLGVCMMFFGLLYTCSLFVNNIIFYIPFLNQIRESYLYSCFFAYGTAIVGAFGLKTILEFQEGYVEKLNNPAGMSICCGLILFCTLFPQKFTWRAFVTVCGLIMLLSIWKILSIKTYQIASFILILFLVVIEFFSFRSALGADGKYKVEEAVMSVSQSNLNVLGLLEKDDLPSNGDSWRLLQWNTDFQAYPSNIWSVWGYYDAFGYMNPIPEGAMNIHLTWGLDKRAALSNIRYIICTSQEDESFLNWLSALGFKEIKRVAGITSHYDEKDTVEDVVFENENRKGNAWLVEKCIGYSDKNDVNDLNDIINSEDFQPFSTALVNMDTSDEQLKDIYGSAENSEVSMMEYNANSLKFQVNASEEVLLITSEMMASGWEVYIDGKKGDILEVNTAFRGCVVPQGNHVVEYRYLPKTFIIGCILAGVSMLSVMAICISVLWTSKKH